MRKTTATYFMSLDGVVEAPEKWHPRYFSDEMGATLAASLADADTLLFGRKTYDTMAATWPKREAAGDEGFAKTLGDARKIVVSHKRLDLTWRNSEQLDGDLIDAVATLKAASGRDIALNGSVSIARQLIDARLLDELHIFLDPLVLRRGMRLFDEADMPVHLEVLSARSFQNGVQHLVYSFA